MKRAIHNQGAALLTVLVALMVISIMLFEFQYASMVEQKLAYNELNQIQAYYLAKSGIRLGLLRITLYARAKKDPNVKNLIKQVPGGGALIDGIWNMPLPAFPPDATKLSDLDKGDRDAAEQTLEQTKVSDGKSTHLITDESMKINLNDLVVPEQMRSTRIDFRSDSPQGPFWYTGRLLINLMDNFLRDSENPTEEYGDLRPEDVVVNFMDWVTPGENSFAGGNKDLAYEKMSPPYKAKRNKFYSVDEVRMIKGVDEHLYAKLRPYITVYADQGKVNINTNSREDFYRALVPSLRADDVKKVLEERDKRGGWNSEEDFAQYIKTTFGNSEFDKLYPKKEEYPFTVSSQSFLIEAMGKLDKSRSSIQKIIRVAVLLRSIGANCDGLDGSKCQTVAACFFDQRDNRCKSKPRSSAECTDLVSSQYSEAGGQFCCTIQVMNASQQICYNPATDAPKGPVEPNAVKIVHWSET
ncbi:MAG: type II secretion system minor pseudopilin GspK [Deltaproteobacteria bacterium]|nr:type II secretion system minor pseudopilin GspK [Deltaproteobacteria bacterium]MBI3293834.1 type II secretion system minor pseudopilin GspK [Deltaproteobacteria bacterium]